MAEKEEKDPRMLRIICLMVGIAASLLVMRFILGQTGILAGAVAGAAGAILGTLLFALVLKFRG